MAAERQNLFAYTEPSTPVGAFVGYVSINRETDGQITLTVRERGDGTKQATIALSPETLEHLAVDVLTAIDGEPHKTRVAELEAEVDALRENLRLTAELAHPIAKEAAERARRRAGRAG